MFIIVDGPIGIGKTTQAIGLRKNLGFTPTYETVEGHPSLAHFYEAMNNFEDEPDELNLIDLQHSAFVTQMFFLFNRWHKHNQALIVNKHVVADRSIYADKIFAEMLAKKDYIKTKYYEEVYLPAYNVLTGFLMYPNLIVYIDADPEFTFDRIKSRGRDIENGMSLAYIKDLTNHYRTWYKAYPYPKIKVDGTKLDKEGLVLACILKGMFPELESTNKNLEFKSVEKVVI